MLTGGGKGSAHVGAFVGTVGAVVGSGVGIQEGACVGATKKKNRMDVTK
jgi:hypothetical protein